jgi:hypothetical protein
VPAVVELTRKGDLTARGVGCKPQEDHDGSRARDD